MYRQSVARLQTWARALKRDVVALWLAMKHPDTPWYARALAAAITAYALSPIDLIPDFIPVLGYVDDLIIVPAGVWLLIKIMPEHVLIECRAESDKWFQQHSRKPRSIVGLTIVLMLWGLTGWALLRLFW